MCSSDLPVTAGAIELAGGLGGAFLASGAAQKVTDWMHEVFDPQDYAQRKAEKEAHPYEAFAGQTLASLAGMSPKVAPEIAGKFMTKPAMQRATSAALQTGIEAGTEYFTEGKVDPIKLGVAATTGVALPGFNIAGKIPFAAGEKVGSKIANIFPGGKAKPTTTTTTDLPKSEETSTPEERAAVIAKLEKMKQERLSKVPLVEAAIRNKETGEIERMGPKHDEQRKLDTADTHEQGFLDEEGNFLNRKQAWNRAISSGQIPKDAKPTVMGEGLHSGDLRNAGDKRFEITDTQPAGVPHSETPVLQTPKTREEFKTAIESIDSSLLDTRLAAEKARAEGNVEKAVELKTRYNELTSQKEQLHKDMPSVKFQNIAKPTWAELHDHLYGVKNIGEAFDRIINTDNLGSEGQRALIKALNRSSFIRDAELQLSKESLTWGGEDVAGLYYGDAAHKVQLGSEGGLQTLLHESIHAGTQRLIAEGKSAAAVKLKELYTEFSNKHSVVYEAKLEQFKRDNPNATLKDLEAFKEKNVP